MTSPMAEESAVDDPFTVWQGEPLQSCDDLIYVLYLTNPRECAMKYKIMLKASPNNPANLVVPSEGIFGRIEANKIFQPIATLPKARAIALEADGLTEIQKLQVTIESTEDS